jgi:uncharacterized cofD-like protein
VVAIGGGHGLAASLRAIRRYTESITAVVSTADDGGSSGRLRELFAIPAPGDIRRCLLALADPASPLESALALRFDRGELDGHTAGNLLMTALAQTSGDFQTAIDTVANLLGCVGRVVPATLDLVELVADSPDGPLVGQVAVAEAGSVSRVGLEPANPSCPPAALDAVASANQVVIGPGSLFTSVVAGMAVPALAEAVRTAGAQRVYVCNLHPEAGETDGFDVASHLQVLTDHGIAVDCVVYDPATMESGDFSLPSVAATLAAANGLVHDPALLAGVLSNLAKSA